MDLKNCDGATGGGRHRPTRLTDAAADWKLHSLFLRVTVCCPARTLSDWFGSPGKWNTVGTAIRIALGVVALGVLFPVAVAAQCPSAPLSGIAANPNRPTIADPADIGQFGVLELEYGY